MCYFAFIRYTCGCAPLNPVLIPTGLMCPSHCHDRHAPTTNYSTPKYLGYACNTCQLASGRGITGRMGVEFVDSVVEREVQGRQGASVSRDVHAAHRSNAGARGATAIDVPEGSWNLKTGAGSIDARHIGREWWMNKLRRGPGGLRLGGGDRENWRRRGNGRGGGGK